MYTYRGHLSINALYQTARITTFSLNRIHPSLIVLLLLNSLHVDGWGDCPFRPRHIFETVTSSVLTRIAWSAVSQSHGSFLYGPTQNKYSRLSTGVEVKSSLRFQCPSKQGRSLLWSALRIHAINLLWLDSAWFYVHILCRNLTLQMKKYDRNQNKSLPQCLVSVNVILQL
jgi:hypothetical protein